MRVYLDHNATSPLRPEAAEAMRTALSRGLANPSSLHEEGRAARAVVEAARADVGALVGAAASDVVFTSGGTEAVAAGILGACIAAAPDRRRIVVSAVEHSSVIESARVASRLGHAVDIAPCDPEGRVDVGAFTALLGPDVVVAALQWANNETGVVQPIDEVGAACDAAGVVLLVDAVQGAGKLHPSAGLGAAGLVALSAHKLGGPQGAGALVVRHGLVLAPIVPGGSQERRRRGGTEAVGPIAGFGAAARAALRDRPAEETRLRRLRDDLEGGLRELFPDLRLHGAGGPRLGNTSCFAIPGAPGELLAIALDVAGWAVSTGSACSSGATEPSHVLRAMGVDEREARGAIRVSLGWSTRAADVESLLRVLPGLAARVRAPSTAPA